MVDAGLGHTAEGDQVAAPWTRLSLCAGIGRPYEDPPTGVEPGAPGGEWGFGTAEFPPVGLKLGSAGRRDPSQGYVLIRVPTDTWGQTTPENTSRTVCVYWSWRN